MNIDQQKKELRKQLLQLRSQLDSTYCKEYSSWACQQLEHIIDKNNYKTVHVYLPMKGEINIFPLIENLLLKKITVVSPKTLPNRKLENRILTSLTEIEHGVFGTLHPANPVEYKDDIDLIIVPGLAYDNNKFRLGYGGGYYDSFLINHPKALKIGIFYPEQKVDKVPTEIHDIALDTILVNHNQ